MLFFAAAGVALGLISVLVATVMWRTLHKAFDEAERQRLTRFQSVEAELREASGAGSQSRQRVAEVEAFASSVRLNVERSQQMAELAARASQESAEAANRSAKAALETVTEAARSADAAAQSALAARSCVSTAASAAAAAEACVRTGEQNAQGGQLIARAAASSADSASRSADAAAEVAHSNRVAGELGRRAWVHATEFRATLKPQGNENSTLEVRIANLGNTPALELKVTTNFHIEDAVPDELPLKPRVNNIVLGPGVNFSISHFLRLSPADLAAIGTGRRILLASGQADYVDVFGVARQTRWCAVYHYNGNSFGPAEKHNLTT